MNVSFEGEILSKEPDPPLAPSITEMVSQHHKPELGRGDNLFSIELVLVFLKAIGPVALFIP